MIYMQMIRVLFLQPDDLTFIFCVLQLCLSAQDGVFVNFMLISQNFLRLCSSQTSCGSHMNYRLICQQIKQTVALEFVESVCNKVFGLNSFFMLAPKRRRPSPADTNTIKEQRFNKHVWNIHLKKKPQRRNNYRFEGCFCVNSFATKFSAAS